MITEHTFLVLLIVSFGATLYATHGARAIKIGVDAVATALIATILWAYLTFILLAENILVSSTRYVTNITSNTTLAGEFELLHETRIYETATTYLTDPALSAFALMMAAVSLLIFIYTLLQKLYSDTDTLL